MSTRLVTQHTITPEQRALAERFLAAFNAIDGELRHRLDLRRNGGFPSVVDEYSRQNPNWVDGVALLQYAELRNFLVHERRAPDAYLSIPVVAVVEHIESIRDRLLNPQLVIPTYQRDVVTVSPDDRLDQVLAKIRDQAYSQFPVYDDASQFVGLLTENGITRWLAQHIDLLGGTTLVEFEDHCVRHVLNVEEARNNVRFIARTTSVEEVEALFARHADLEAVLITHSGKASEKPLGIITSYDASRIGPG